MCHLAIGSAVQFFRQFIGSAGNGFPEVMVHNRPETFFQSTRIHTTEDCTSVAMSFASGNFSLSPSPTGSSRPPPPGAPPSPGGPTTYFILQNTTLWYSKATVDVNERTFVISAAEESLSQSWELLVGYGADHSPNNSAYYSEFGWLPDKGDLQMTRPVKASDLPGGSNGPAKTGRPPGPPPDKGIPCLRRDEDMLIELPGGMVRVSADGMKSKVEKEVEEEGQQIAEYGGGWGPYGFVEAMDPTPESSITKSEESGSSLGVLIGAAIAGLILAALLGLIGLFVIKRHRSGGSRNSRYRYDRTSQSFDWGAYKYAGPDEMERFNARGGDGSRGGPGGRSTPPQSGGSHADSLNAMSAVGDRTSGTASGSGSASHDYHTVCFDFLYSYVQLLIHAAMVRFFVFAVFLFVL